MDPGPGSSGRSGAAAPGASTGGDRRSRAASHCGPNQGDSRALGAPKERPTSHSNPHTPPAVFVGRASAHVSSDHSQSHPSCSSAPPPADERNARSRRVAPRLATGADWHDMEHLARRRTETAVGDRPSTRRSRWSDGGTEVEPFGASKGRRHRAVESVSTSRTCPAHRPGSSQHRCTRRRDRHHATQGTGPHSKSDRDFGAMPGRRAPTRCRARGNAVAGAGGRGAEDGHRACNIGSQSCLKNLGTTSARRRRPRRGGVGAGPSGFTVSTCPLPQFGGLSDAAVAPRPKIPSPLAHRRPVLPADPQGLRSAAVHVVPFSWDAAHLSHAQFDR